MPVISSSDIQRTQAMLTYAIMAHCTVDVGRVINMEINAVADTRSKHALGFPVLITHLCHLVEANLSSDDPTNAIKLQPKIIAEMYFPV